jgi:hypothetical protein
MGDLSRCQWRHFQAHIILCAVCLRYALRDRDIENSCGHVACGAIIRPCCAGSNAMRQSWTSGVSHLYRPAMIHPARMKPPCG